MTEEIRVVEVPNAGRAKRVQSLLSRLRRRVRGGRHAQLEEFKSILEIANSVAKQDPNALPALIKLIGRSAQALTMTTVLRQRQNSEHSSYDPDTVLFNGAKPLTADGRNLDDLKRQVSAPRALVLGVDLVMPWPWNRGRTVKNLCKLRPGGEWGAWCQDSNHCIELWLPLGIGWVVGGNHSLTVGILHAKGKVKPEVTFDISEVYKYVICDGIKYKRKHDGSTISPVSDLEMAAIFEIGRLVHKHRVSF